MDISQFDFNQPIPNRYFDDRKFYFYFLIINKSFPIKNRITQMEIVYLINIELISLNRKNVLNLTFKIFTSNTQIYIA